MTHEEYWYMLCTMPNIWSAQIGKILNYFGSPEEFIDCDDAYIEKSGILTKSELKSVFNRRNNKKCLDELERIKKNGVDFLYYDHPDFPKRLKIIDDPPYSLYVKGKIPDKTKYSVGIVGSRNASGYGKEMTVRFAGNLAANGIQIISGMAVGIDGFASKGALMVGGDTFVVLGTGIDVIYPRENIELYYEIVLRGGVISEYPPGTQGTPWHFPHRNRLISGLSDKLLIMEARKRSGTLTTAQHALNQNVDIYALPGRLTDEYSEGCNKLIADGCGVLTNMEDFLFDLYSKKPFEAECCLPAASKNKSLNSVLKKDLKQNNECKNTLEGSAAVIYKLIGYSPVSVQEIIDRTKICTEEVVLKISELELMGLIENVSTDIYARTT